MGELERYEPVGVVTGVVISLPADVLDGGAPITGAGIALAAGCGAGELPRSMERKPFGGGAMLLAML